MFTLNDVLAGNEQCVLLQGANAVSNDLVFPAAHHDSRQIGRGDLFVAIKGEHVDGHTFIPIVAQNGAAAALCTNPARLSNCQRISCKSLFPTWWRPCTPPHACACAASRTRR